MRKKGYMPEQSLRRQLEYDEMESKQNENAAAIGRRKPYHLIYQERLKAAGGRKYAGKSQQGVPGLEQGGQARAD